MYKKKRDVKRRKQNGWYLGLDHVARIVAGNEISTSRTADQLTAQHSAINMLTGRVKLILEYMKVKKEEKKISD